MAKCVTKFLSADEIDRIRVESMKILGDVGVKVSHDEAKTMLENAGAKVEHQSDLVRIPTELIEDCLQVLPQNVLLAGRNPDKDAIVGDSNERTYPRTLSGAEAYIDPYDGKRRRAVMSDVRDWAVLVDGLENIYQCTAPYYSDAGLNLNARDVRAFEILLENTTKHILIQPYGPQNLEFCIKLALAEKSSAEELKKRPRFSAHVSPVSPLHYHGNTISMMFLAGKYGIPISLCTIPICGVGGPVTLAGSVLLAVAEYLAAVVIHQLANPGAPMIIAPRPEPVNMTTGSILTGSVESAMMAAALVQVAKEAFGWPIDVIGPTESFFSDAQTIIEKSFGIIFTSCAGADILSGAGVLETGITDDPAQLVIDNEVYGMVSRSVRGIEMNDDTLGLDVIRRIGAGVGKSYLSDEHTLKYFRTEYYKPTIINRSSREEWEAEGSKDLYERARERAISILEQHKPTPLEEDVVKELRAISESAEKEIRETTTV